MIYYICVFLFIMILFFFINNRIEHFDNSTSATPNQQGTAWNLVNSVIKSPFMNGCNIGAQCSTANGFGVYNKSCECIVDPNTKPTSENIDSEYSIKSSYKKMYSTVNSANSSADNNSKKNCIPNTDFNIYCKNIDPLYGVKEIEKCDDTSSIVKCDKYYLNGKYIGNSIKTPCLNKTDDFDTWCRFYNNKDIPKGFNVNSIGAKEILIGEKGGCYTSDGKSNTNSASAICDYNYVETVYKLEPVSDSVTYNKFTHCLPINSNQFTNVCNELLDKTNSYAVEIMGYDCNPGFGRAKCIKNEDYNDSFAFNNNNGLFNNQDDNNNQNTQNKCPDSCYKK